MAANTAPIFPVTPNIGAVTVGGSANTRSDGNGTIGTDIYKAFTAGADGAYVYKVRFSPCATVAGTSTAGTVLRVFVSSATSGAVTQSNTFLIAEVTAGAVTADSSSAATSYYEVALNFAVPANWTILVSSHVVNATNTSWEAVVFGGNY